MIITPTKEIKDYLNRVKKNLDSNYQNDYLDGYVDVNDELEAKKELMKAGQQEYEMDINNPLFIKASEYKENPYVKNIKLDSIIDDHFSYELVTIEKGYLFNSDAIIDDKESSLVDKLPFFSKVNLMLTAQELDRMHFKCSIALIKKL